MLGKTEAQQAGLTGHRARELWGTEGRALANQIRGVVLEDGLVSVPGSQGRRRALPEWRRTEPLPELVRAGGTELPARLRERERGGTEDEPRMEQRATQNAAATRLLQGAGGGPMPATALGATSGEGHALAHGRQFAAWLGLVPRQTATGGKRVLGRIPKPGTADRRPRLRHGARAVLQGSAKRPEQKSRGVEAGRRRRGNHLAAGALAAKQARIVWALRARGQEDRRAA